MLSSVAASNANAGGNYLTLGDQSLNVRGIGLLHTIQDMKNVLVAEHKGVPVYLGDLGDVHEGFQPRLGRVGVDENNDAIEGIVLLDRGLQSLPALKAVRAKIEALNNGLLPRGMHISTHLRPDGPDQRDNAHGSRRRDIGTVAGDPAACCCSWATGEFR